MVAELGSMTANGQPVQPSVNHDGVANITINQDNINQLMDGAQRVEVAAASVNEGNAI